MYGFTGRDAELAALDAVLGGGVAAVCGTGGVGKTALAVHWAHRVAGRFPDGQLYADLRGYDRERPVQPADALAAFLRALGVASDELPHDDDGRAALYRSLLAGRRVLVVLDNSHSADQVRALVPGTPCVVTSRDSLPDLDARHIDLDLLPADQAVAPSVGDGITPKNTLKIICWRKLRLTLRAAAGGITMSAVTRIIPSNRIVSATASVSTSTNK